MLLALLCEWFSLRQLPMYYLIIHQTQGGLMKTTQVTMLRLLLMQILIVIEVQAPTGARVSMGVLITTEMQIYIEVQIHIEVVHQIIEVG